MRKSLKKIKIKELAGLINSQLEKHEVEAVLTGGACVTIFSGNKYQSLDLDFVTYAVEDAPKEITKAMQELGFKRTSQGYFEHASCPFIVEFIPPPLAVGSEPVKKISCIKTKLGRLRLLSPTDCIKDRLAAYYHWDDLQSFQQAIMVAGKQKINFKELRRWSRVEGQLEKFNEFIKRLRK